MTVRAEKVERIDAFIAARKRIVSADFQSRWEETRIPDERIMKWPLECDGEVLPGAMFAITGNPRRRDILFARLHIFCPATVCRLDYTDETHPNTLSGQAMGLPPLVEGPHYHSWRLNRRFFNDFGEPTRLLDAESFTGNYQTLDAILRWFCADLNIDQPPPGHRIELPRLERLF